MRKMDQINNFLLRAIKALFSVLIINSTLRFLFSAIFIFISHFSFDTHLSSVRSSYDFITRTTLTRTRDSSRKKIFPPTFSAHIVDDKRDVRCITSDLITCVHQIDYHLGGSVCTIVLTTRLIAHFFSPCRDFSRSDFSPP